MTGTASAALRDGEAQVAVLRVWYPASQNNTLCKTFGTWFGTLGSVKGWCVRNSHTHAEDK
jgi:hypothetical protein